VKYFCLTDTNWENIEKVTEAWKRVLDERSKGSDRWPKRLLFEPHQFTVPGLLGKKDGQGFFIFETDKEEHLVNYMMHYANIQDVKIIPIVETKKAVSSWLGMK
jgi:hypothetical protein